MPWIEQLQSVNWIEAAGVFLAAYALGCFTTGYYLVRLRLGQDIHDSGSGSVGARNVGRLLGWRGFLLTVLGDFGKGALAVWAARHFTMDDRLVLLAMLAVVAGHVWPMQLRFRGGKGMAWRIPQQEEERRTLLGKRADLAHSRRRGQSHSLHRRQGGHYRSPSG